MMEALDTEIGRLLTVVDRANTDIIFVGDNGTEAQFQQPPYRPPANHGKFSIYEGGMRVPMLITGPDVASPGRINHSLVNVVDIFQTIQELAGIDVGATLPAGVTIDSKSLLPALQADVLIPGEVLGEVFNQGPAADGQSLRDEQFKLIRFDSNTEQFYDLGSDPYENTNLLPEPLTATAQAHYYSLKRKFQKYLALPNDSLTRDPFPFPAHRSFDLADGMFALGFEYSHLRVDAIYTLWRTPDLANPLAWAPVATSAIGAVPTGPLGTDVGMLTDDKAAGDRYFYQVVPSLW